MTSEPRVLSGRYRVDDLIGQGGMASVHRGYDLTLGRPVAIKLLKRELAEDQVFRTRFRLEAQAASRMANPTIVRVFDAGEDTATDDSGASYPVPYIIMELVQGELLKDIIAAGPVPLDDAVRYVDGILEALEYSHRAGVVHRDIKPGNVMVTARGHVKVMDFGIARAVSDSSSTVADTTAIIGTAAYFSPEQAKGETVDARADLYSTGVVLFELLTGRAPFRGDTPVAVAYQHVSETPATPSEINESVPRALDAVVLRALAKDPYQRYQSAAEFREALDAATDGRAPTKKQVGALSNELYGPNPKQAAETARTLRQLSSDPSTPRTQAGPPVAWIWTGVAVVAVVIFSLVFWLVTIRPWVEVPSSARIVPDVVGMTYEEALVEITASDLQARRSDETDPSVPEGSVIRVSPAPGTSVDIGLDVDVFVSSGAEQAEVPTLEGLTEDEARTAIEAAGLRVGQITSRSVPGMQAGIVLTAIPATGQQVERDSTVNLTVATGLVAVINYEGWRLDAAISDVQSDRYLLSADTVEDPECAAADPPTIATQSAVGDVAVGSTIVFTVCSG